jgi:hypothetical protein
VIRAFAAWWWLISATGAAFMLAPHVPLLVGQVVVEAVRDRGQG